MTLGGGFGGRLVDDFVTPRAVTDEETKSNEEELVGHQAYPIAWRLAAE
ncbi:hypothetical protein [Tabrizicola sp.]